MSKNRVPRPWHAGEPSVPRPLARTARYPSARCSGGVQAAAQAARASAALLLAVAAEASAAPGPEVCPASPARYAGQTAFPTAEGFGKFALGGRGGRVIAVTSLADDGPGSLRACAEASGARTCVFRVSGTIVVDRWISDQNPYLPIAGQTSPGGIAIRIGKSANTPLLIQTHDVVVRHLRLRPGPAQTPSENVDTVQISGGAHDVILDHLSTSWPTDEGINIVGDGNLRRPCKDTRNVTVQWSILSEGLNRANRGPHSRGTYFGYGARDISFHHNLIANNDRRNPLLNTRGQFDMINNVMFNSARYNGDLYTRFGELSVNAIGNLAILGPSSNKTTQMYLFSYFRDYPAKFAIYLAGNLDIHRRQDSGSEGLVLAPNGWKYVATRPLGKVSLERASITGPAQAYRDVLAYAGATVPARDAGDVRLIGDIARCRGAIIDDPAQVGGWPALTGPPAPPDRDGDGMPDAWELTHGLSPADPSDGQRQSGTSGYTNLEVYLNTLAGDATGGRAGTARGRDPDVTCGFRVVAAPPLPVVSVSARPSTIAPGGATTISWSGTGLKACRLLGSAVPIDGSRVVRPRDTHVYEIRCTGQSGGDAIDSVVVEVREDSARAPGVQP